MRVETKATIIIWTVTLVTTFVVGFLMLLMINEAFGTETPIGEPYLASYSYCAVTTYGVKGQSWCSQYKTGHEMRQKTHIKGLFFDGTGDHLVVQK
jgi:hypothetical protein